MSRLARLRKTSFSLCALLLIPSLTYLGSNEPAHAVATATVVIDPGNVSSYPGTGTTVTSIGSNTLTGTMANVTYNSANGGKFVFNGTSSSISFNAFDFTSTFTIVAWVKPVSQTTIGTLISNAAANGQTNGFKAYWNSWNTSDRKMIFESGNGNAGTGTWAFTDTATVTNASWQQVAYVVNRTSGVVNFYLNGVAQPSAANAIRTDFGTNQTWWIGSMSGSNYWLNADVGLLKIFTSNLNQADITSEYSSGATRYGLPVTPTISTNPANATTPSGSTSTFTTSASISDGGSLSYQWQVSTDSGSTWSNVSSGTGGTSNSYTTPATSISMSGYQYKVIVTNTLSGNTSTAISAAATLTVTKATPNITFSIPFNGITLAKFRTNMTITVNSNAAGKVSLKANGRWIPGCRNLDIASSVNCTFKPSLHGQIAITASFTPTSTTNYFSVTTAPAYLSASSRTISRP